MAIEIIAQENIAVGPRAAAAWRVRVVHVLPKYRLSITCNDGTNGIVDMAALVQSPDAGMYAALKDTQLFQQVNIVLGAITWPNGADLDPLWAYEEISINKTWSVPDGPPEICCKFIWVWHLGEDKPLTAGSGIVS